MPTIDISAQRPWCCRDATRWRVTAFTLFGGLAGTAIVVCTDWADLVR